MALFFNIAALLSAVLLGFLYYLGAENFYFYLYPWYDIPLHLLGGLIAGLWACAVASQYKLPPKKALGVVVAVTLPVIVCWEVFEYFSGLTAGEPNYWQDTLKDMFDGTFGALVAWCIYAILKK